MGKTTNTVRNKDDKSILSAIEKIETRKDNRKNVKLFFHPIKTIKIFIFVLLETFMNGVKYFQKRPKSLFFIMLPLSLLILTIYTPGQHQKYLGEYTEFLSVCIYWVVLGVLSSVGLGTGLHTFVLYLGPHIAKVTLVASEWKSLDFETYGDNSFINPMNPIDGGVSFFAILNKIQLAALLWGAGTAIGELPPYFVARTARLKGMKAGDQQDQSPEDKSLIGRLSAYVPSIIGNLGFFGILAFASIPNPLFDLAGLTCGHCLVPFWKFFGATLIGKAVVKAHIQACFVILVCNIDTLTRVISVIEYYIPWATGKIQPILENERKKLNSSQPLASTSKSWGGVAWDCILAIMISYFLISIVDSSVQEYLIKKDNDKIDDLKKKLSTTTSTITKESKKDK